MWGGKTVLVEGERETRENREERGAGGFLRLRGGRESNPPKRHPSSIHRAPSMLGRRAASTHPLFVFHLQSRPHLKTRRGLAKKNEEKMKREEKKKSRPMLAPRDATLSRVSARWVRETRTRCILIDGAGSRPCASIHGTYRLRGRLLLLAGAPWLLQAAHFSFCDTSHSTHVWGGSLSLFFKNLYFFFFVPLPHERDFFTCTVGSDTVDIPTAGQSYQRRRRRNPACVRACASLFLSKPEPSTLDYFYL